MPCLAAYRFQRLDCVSPATFPTMWAVMGRGAVTLYRRVGSEIVYWRTIEGTPEELEAAMQAAKKLDLEAARIGGWGNALRLGLYPSKPVHERGPASGVFAQDGPDGGLRKL